MGPTNESDPHASHVKAAKLLGALSGGGDALCQSFFASIRLKPGADRPSTRLSRCPDIPGASTNRCEAVDESPPAEQAMQPSVSHRGHKKLAPRLQAEQRARER